MDHVGSIPFETSQVFVRPFKMEDAQDMFNNYCTDEEVTRYLPWKPHSSVEDTKSYLSTFVNNYDNKSQYHWAIVDKQTNQVIGAIEASKNDETNKSIMLGWVLAKSHWGKGIMPEVAKQVINLLFKVGYVRIWAQHVVDNAKSGRVMEKVGMTKEGILKKAGVTHKGEFHDVAVWAIVR